MFLFYTLCAGWALNNPQLMVALAGFAGKRVTPVRRLGAAAYEGELL